MNNTFLKTESSLTRGIPRTMFDKPFTHKTSFNAGRMIPLLCERVYPGTTVKMKGFHTITRMATPVNPIMDDIYQDFHFFFVPFRVILEKQAPFSNEWNSATKNWDKFITYGDWEGVSDLKLPTVAFPGATQMAIKPGSVGHYMGLPLGIYTNQYNGKLSLLQLGAYDLIYNQYFRDENYQTERSTLTNVTGSGLTSISGYGSMPYSVNEMHDPFTSVLPSPQKGPDVMLSLGGLAPVVTNKEFNDLSLFPGVSYNSNMKAPLQFFTQAGQKNQGYDGTNYYKWPLIAQVPMNGVEGQSSTSLSMAPALGSDDKASQTTPFGTLNPSEVLIPANLVANLTQATALTINQLRDSIVLQHYFETLARSGSRYNEWLLGFFDVVSPDARLQRAEYITGKRIHINISEVLQTSGEAVNDTVLGSTGAVSRTTSSNNGLFTYSAVEHGFIFCITTVRHALSYSQGLPRQFTDVEALDFYNPIFNGIGEQPIYKREILANTIDGAGIKREEYQNAGSEVGFDDILGFNEPWWDIRYAINRASGLLDPVGATSLNTWTLTKAFTTNNITGAQVRVADDSTIDRVIRVQNEDQFIGEYLFDMEVVAKIPLRSVPGITRI